MLKTFDDRRRDGDRVRHVGAASVWSPHRRGGDPVCTRRPDHPLRPARRLRRSLRLRCGDANSERRRHVSPRHGRASRVRRPLLALRRGRARRITARERLRRARRQLAVARLRPRRRSGPAISHSTAGARERRARVMASFPDSNGHPHRRPAHVHVRRERSARTCPRDHRRAARVGRRNRTRADVGPAHVLCAKCGSARRFAHPRGATAQLALRGRWDASPRRLLATP